MRKFANLDQIQERQEAQKQGLTLEAYRTKRKEETARNREIDKAWALAHKEGKNVRTEVFRKEHTKPAKKEKHKNRGHKLHQQNRAPEMVETEGPRKQYWNGVEWVKLVEKEPVNGN